jgi:hypothetical protein
MYAFDGSIIRGTTYLNSTSVTRHRYIRSERHEGKKSENISSIVNKFIMENESEPLCDGKRLDAAYVSAHMGGVHRRIGIIHWEPLETCSYGNLLIFTQTPTSARRR